MKKRIAVVFGTYNRLPQLKPAIESVRRAAGAHGCIIIAVDGGSTDGSREYLAAQPDVVLIGQRGPLTGAVPAFNLGFAYAVDEGFEHIAHFNDDAEFVTPGALELASATLNADPTVGEVAFEFDLWGPWQFDHVHDRPYANFGLVRRVAGMAVARAQGDPAGRLWWNPIYRTYGADSEFGCWLWKLGWKVHTAHGVRVHDKNVQDALRDGNEANNPQRKDSSLFWSRWATADLLRPASANVSWQNAKIHLGCGAHRLPGWINVDGLPVPAADTNLDIYALHSVPSASAECIYWSHGPEHIFPDRLPDVLQHLRRILKPGGKLLAATIDLVGIWKNRYETQANGPHWNAALYGETQSTDHPFLAHKLCFTESTLRDYFVQAGFKDVRCWQPEEYPEILAINDYAVSCRLVTVHVEGKV